MDLKCHSGGQLRQTRHGILRLLMQVNSGLSATGTETNGWRGSIQALESKKCKWDVPQPTKTVIRVQCKLHHTANPNTSHKGDTGNYPAYAGLALNKGSGVPTAPSRRRGDLWCDHCWRQTLKIGISNKGKQLLWKIQDTKIKVPVPWRPEPIQPWIIWLRITVYNDVTQQRPISQLFSLCLPKEMQVTKERVSVFRSTLG